ncbi:MAG: hypothetical protein IPJ88_07645 [Myxococcales bacterium]|nr:MAG: hypothetical protein IPJ88_07645 [Myxococcales bacterium]
MANSIFKQKLKFLLLFFCSFVFSPLACAASVKPEASTPDEPDSFEKLEPSKEIKESDKANDGLEGAETWEDDSVEGDADDSPEDNQSDDDY